MLFCVMIPLTTQYLKLTRVDLLQIREQHALTPTALPRLQVAYKLTAMEMLELTLVEARAVYQVLDILLPRGMLMEPAMLHSLKETLEV